jgi:hypothetical protein
VFWRALCEGAAQRTDIAGEDGATGAHWLSLAQAPAAAVYWFGQVLLGHHLYVRRCYLQLYSIVEQQWQRNAWVLLLGSPGQCKRTLLSQGAQGRQIQDARTHMLLFCGIFASAVQVLARACFVAICCIACVRSTLRRLSHRPLL